MAIGTVYNSNSLAAVNTVGGDVDLYQIDATQKFALGTPITRVDGNKYRYANFVTATTQGKLVSHVVADTDNASTDALVVAPAAAYQQPIEQVGVYPGAIGSRFIVYTLASVVKDQFAGGYLTVNLDTGYGYIYRIKGNTATSSGGVGTGNLLIELYDKIVVALSATSDTGIVGSLYSDCIVATPATNFVTVGVTMANMTANTFGWICTHGVCACLQDGAVTAGDIIQAGITTAGAYQTMGIGTTNSFSTAAGLNILGYCVQQPATNSGVSSYGTIFLQLE